MYVWDPVKSGINKAKHGISFEEARDHVFEKNNVTVFDVAYSKDGESRHAVIGKFGGHYYTGIFTITELGVRIISVRRSRDEEKKQAIQKGL
jgi:uncharacterized DUF497 family protein